MPQGARLRLLSHAALPFAARVDSFVSAISTSRAYPKCEACTTKRRSQCEPLGLFSVLWRSHLGHRSQVDGTDSLTFARPKKWSQCPSTPHQTPQDSQCPPARNTTAARIFFEAALTVNPVGSLWAFPV